LRNGLVEQQVNRRNARQRSSSRVINGLLRGEAERDGQKSECRLRSLWISP